MAPVSHGRCAAESEEAHECRTEFVIGACRFGTRRSHVAILALARLDEQLFLGGQQAVRCRLIREPEMFERPTHRHLPRFYWPLVFHCDAPSAPASDIMVAMVLHIITACGNGDTVEPPGNVSAGARQFAHARDRIGKLPATVPRQFTQDETAPRRLHREIHPDIPLSYAAVLSGRFKPRFSSSASIAGILPRNAR